MVLVENHLLKDGTCNLGYFHHLRGTQDKVKKKKQNYAYFQSILLLTFVQNIEILKRNLYRMLQQTTSSVLVARASHTSSPVQKKIWRKSSSVFCRWTAGSNGLQLPVHLMKVTFQRMLTIYPVHLSALLTVCVYCICYLSLLRRTCSPQHQGFLLVFIIVMHLKLATSASTMNG